MAVNAGDIQSLTHLAYRIREDTHGLKPWDRTGTHKIFTEVLVGMHLMTAIEMVIAHASDPEARTPRAIERQFLPKRESTLSTDPANCPDHPDELAMPHCRIHKTEYAVAYGEDEAALVPVQPLPKDDAIRIAREVAGFKPKQDQEANQ